MVQTSKSTTSSSGGSSSTVKDVLFKPGDCTVDNYPIIDVTDKPVQIIGSLPEGHTISVYRVYDGAADCLDVPDIPVMCKDGCTPLMLFNVPNEDCPSGSFVQSNIWLYYQGRYKLVYNRPDGVNIVPENVYVWYKKDVLVSKLGINLPLCGENTCPPIEDPHTIVTDNGDGTYTATNSDGTEVTWDVNFEDTDTFVTVTDNGDGTYTAVNVNGVEVTWSTNFDDKFVTITDNNDGTITGTNTDGTEVTWDKQDTFTNIVDNEDGTYTATNPDGQTITWQSGTPGDHTEIVDNGDGTYTATNPDGTTVTWTVTTPVVKTTEVKVEPGLDVDVEVTSETTTYNLSLDLCELEDRTAAQFALEFDTSHFAMCIAGDTVKLSAQNFYQVALSLLDTGDGIEITGAGTPEDPYTISLNLCSLNAISQSAVEEASCVMVAGCVDGQTGKFKPSNKADGVTVYPSNFCCGQTTKFNVGAYVTSDDVQTNLIVSEHTPDKVDEIWIKNVNLTKCANYGLVLTGIGDSGGNINVEVNFQFFTNGSDPSAPTVVTSYSGDIAVTAGVLKEYAIEDVLTIDDIPDDLLFSNMVINITGGSSNTITENFYLYSMRLR